MELLWLLGSCSFLLGPPSTLFKSSFYLGPRLRPWGASNRGAVAEPGAAFMGLRTTRPWSRPGPSLTDNVKKYLLSVLRGTIATEYLVCSQTSASRVESSLLSPCVRLCVAWLFSFVVCERSLSPDSSCFHDSTHLAHLASSPLLTLHSLPLCPFLPLPRPTSQFLLRKN